ncbi:hypothetical protein [Anaeromyxobacter oryzae]|uniref:ABC transporter permease n=1 Tax=Anaeromyxobacter oryzae TaxID=2918170 RepID=A0ABM7WYI0_9BACT|nr:hypothetical protein [Anaeromyxobacter oryzae]BDG04579.1 hypothetical protein AMOR_35750 [Anaeromyxobacter oryzae]
MERFSPGAVLGRSFSLWGKHFVPFTLVGVFLVGAVLLVFMIAVAAGSYAAIGLGGEAAGVSPGLLGAVQQALLEVGATPMAIALAVAYHDLRVLKEGVDTAQVAVVFE